MRTRLLLACTLVASAFAQERTPLLPPEPGPPVAKPAPPEPRPKALPVSEIIPDWQARWDLARALSYLKKYDESLAEYRRVLQERPDDPAVRQDYGQVLLWAGRVQESNAELRKVPVEKLTSEAAVALADTLVAQGDFPGAEQLYRRQLERKSGDHLTRLKLAEILSWTKRVDESIRLFQQILGDLPDDVQVRRRYALALLAGGRNEDAAAELRRTLPQ